MNHSQDLEPPQNSGRFTAPNGAVLIDGKPATLVAEKQGIATLTVRLRPSVTPTFGKHKYEVSLDGHRFDYEFDIQLNRAKSGDK